MAIVVIGGTDYEVPEMNFISLERAWPYVEAAMGANVIESPLTGPAAGIMVIAAGIMEADYFNKVDFGVGENEPLGDSQLHDRVGLFLKRKLKAREMGQIKEALEVILKEAGLEFGEPGEPQANPATATASPSPETAADTSPSSSPQDARGEAGTA